MKRIIFGVLIGLGFASIIEMQTREEPIPREVEREPDPDPNREVSRYDWKTKSYIYKDSKDSTPEVIPLTRELESTPDYSVSIEDRRPVYVEHEGKRYKVFTRADGTQVLQPWK